MREAPRDKFATKNSVKPTAEKQIGSTSPMRRKRSQKDFAKELDRLIKSHGDTHITLRNSVFRTGERYSPDIFARWVKGKTIPRTPSSFALLQRVEEKYRLKANHFREILKPETPSGRAIGSVPACERYLVRWHLPGNFDQLTAEEREKVIDWIRVNVLGGSTGFGKYLKSKSDVSFRLRFEGREAAGKTKLRSIFSDYADKLGIDEERKSSNESKPSAPRELVREITELVKFKLAAFSLPGYQRYSGWAKATAEMRADSYCRIMGAATASPRSEIGGFGIPKSHLSLALMAVPSFWDWFLSWSGRRRGFFTKYELNILCDGSSLLRAKTGWIWQHPELATKLSPIPGMLTRLDIRRARRDWQSVCDSAHNHLRMRIVEVRKLMRTHRDPFEPILPVLRSDNPLKVYKKIATEVLRRMPNTAVHPVEAAEATRSYLMLRLGMHLGFRQRNLRELLLSQPGEGKRSDLALREMRCGEIRWSELDKAWEVYAPYLAFKNWDSTFFSRQAYRQLLPDVDGLYYWIRNYLGKHRSILLNGRIDPGTFFVRKMRSDRVTPAMDSKAFHFAWRDTIQRYGIYNPYTKRGAIKGLLPHGPHAVRDVLATHVIKQTATYDLAAFAVQDTARTIKEFYGRFLPEEKISLVSKLLNKTWQRR